MRSAPLPLDNVLQLDAVVTQATFGALVGVSQQAVSDLQARGVLAAGQPVGVWLTAYCDHMREVAAGRDPDGLLAGERTRLAREQADRIALQNALARREYAPVVLLEELLASAARQVGTQLDAILPEMRRRFPYLAGEPVRFLEERLVAAREAAASATFNADQIEADLGEEEEPA